MTSLMVGASQRMATRRSKPAIRQKRWLVSTGCKAHEVDKEKKGRANGQSTMRRRTEREGAKQVREATDLLRCQLQKRVEPAKSVVKQLKRFFARGDGTDLQYLLHDPLLQTTVVDPHTPASHFLPVEHEIVVLPSNARYVSSLHRFEILSNGRGERMVGGGPSSVCEEVLVRVGFGEERETDDPEEVRVGVVSSKT